MTTINDIADLVRVLQENPEWLITLRGVIISDDLATVPASLKEINRRLDNLQTELTTVGGRVSNPDRPGLRGLRRPLRAAPHGPARGNRQHHPAIPGRAPQRPVAARAGPTAVSCRAT